MPIRPVPWQIVTVQPVMFVMVLLKFFFDIFATKYHVNTDFPQIVSKFVLDTLHQSSRILFWLGSKGHYENSFVDYIIVIRKVAEKLLVPKSISNSYENGIHKAPTSLTKYQHLLAFPKEMQNGFINFSCSPGSRSCDHKTMVLAWHDQGSHDLDPGVQGQ